MHGYFAAYRKEDDPPEVPVRWVAIAKLVEGGRKLFLKARDSMFFFSFTP